MDFTISKQALEAVLKRVEKCWGNKDKPIMNTLYFKADSTNNEVVLRATNGHQSIETTFPVQLVTADGEACIDAYTLTKVVKTFKDGDVTIQLNANGNTVDVHHKTGQVEIASADPTQFPSYTGVAEESKFVIDQKDLGEALDYVKFAALKNPVGSDAKLGGIGLFIDNGKATVACTDRRRIAKFEFTAANASDMTIVIPTDVLDVLPANAGNIEVKLADNGIEIETADVKYRSSVLADSFPAIAKFFSVTSPIEAFIPTDQLKDVMDRISIVAKASNVSAEADFQFGPTGLKISYSPKNGKGKVDEIIPVTKYNGNPINMTFNVDILMGAITRIKTADTEFRLFAHNKPALIYADSKRDFGFLALAIV